MASNTPSVVESLEPSAVWRFFAGIAAVPRASKKEDQVRRHLTDVAAKAGLKVRDEQGNLVIEAPASPGCEKAPITVLQAHFDMVCEKNSGVAHDFDRDPIRLHIDRAKGGEQIVRAQGTTLGADNGIGVAMALAAATAKDIVRPPLELLLTWDEEAGMSGAKSLTPQMFRGRRLLNLDSEEDDAIYIGCAGGGDTNLTWRLPLAAIDGNTEACEVSVSGLRGGHSGANIHENRGNAIKLLTRTLSVSGVSDIRIVSINGGSKRNAIPREAGAVIVVPQGAAPRIAVAADLVQREALHEAPEAQLCIQVLPRPAAGLRAASSTDSVRLIAALAAIPSGVLEMHGAIAGLVQTSNNLSTVVGEPPSGGDTLTVEAGTLSRSSQWSRLTETLRQVSAIGRLAGAEIHHANEYPGWDPNPDSPTLATCKRVYQELFNEPPRVAAIHAGLECGIIGERVGGMDMVSFGPRIEGAHSPDECVFIESVGKSWRYLCAVLAGLAKA